MSTATVTFRLPHDLKARLEKMARFESRSLSQLMLLKTQEIVEEDEAKNRMVAEAMAEADKGLFIPGEEVMAWFDSLGTENELPAPIARKLES